MSTVIQMMLAPTSKVRERRAADDWQPAVRHNSGRAAGRGDRHHDRPPAAAGDPARGGIRRRLTSLGEARQRAIAQVRPPSVLLRIRGPSPVSLCPAA